MCRVLDFRLCGVGMSPAGMRHTFVLGVKLFKRLFPERAWAPFARNGSNTHERVCIQLFLSPLAELFFGSVGIFAAEDEAV